MEETVRSQHPEFCPPQTQDQNPLPSRPSRGPTISTPSPLASDFLFCLQILELVLMQERAPRSSCPPSGGVGREQVRLQGWRGGSGRACSAGAEWGGVGWGASTKPKYLNITDLRHCLWPAGHGWLCKPHVCQKAAHRAENRNPGRSRLHSHSVGAQRSLHSTYFFLDQRFSPRGDFASRRPLCLETFLAVTSQGCSGYLVGERPGCR